MPIEQLCVLGATGSIGKNTLDVVSRHPDRYSAFALTAHSDHAGLFKLCQQHQPKYAALICPLAAESLREALATSKLDTTVLAGEEQLEWLAAHEAVSIVMAAIVGAAGLKPNLAAAQAGKKVLLANKESLVMAGELFMTAVREAGAVLLPIDSEHNAIYQSLPSAYRCGEALPSSVNKLLLTASGGPFRGFSAGQLDTVTPEQACNHPNWDMGRKISVDSASLMNKGLELIEACWLFNVSPEQVEVHIHPESIIHSLVEYIDGSVLAQLGNPDMRIPIAYGLAWPERIESGAGGLDLFTLSQLNFQRPDYALFPCLKLAASAFNAGGTACAVLNAANEVAVAAFLEDFIGFTTIPEIIRSTLAQITPHAADTLEVILEADNQARKFAQEAVANHAR